MKKIKYIFIAFSLLLLVGCIKKEPEVVNNISEDSNKPSHNLYVCVNSLYGSKEYDLEIKIDGYEIGTVSKGNSFSKMVSVKEGNHVFSVNKLGKPNKKAEKVIKVYTDTTFICDVKHKGSIELLNLETLEGTERSELEMEDVTDLLLSKAKRKLYLAGFTNIKVSKSSSEDTDFVVTNQTVAPGEKIGQNKLIELDCIPINEYLAQTYKTKTVLEVQEMAKKSGFTVTYLNNSGTNIDEKVIFMMEPEKEKWKVIDVSQKENSMINVRISRGDN